MIFILFSLAIGTG